MKVTIKDIAKEANVSISAVSLILNNRPNRLSEKTKKRVRMVAEKYHYVANPAAKYLVTKKSMMIGIIIPDIENIFFSTLVKDAEEYCRAQGYSLMIVNSNEKYEEDLKLIQLMANRHVDGFLIALSNESINHQEEIMASLKVIKTPYVMIDRTFNNENASRVYFDNAIGVELAISHLVQQGHQRIAYIGLAPFLNNQFISRYDGYLKAVKKYHLDIRDQYLYFGDYRIKSGYEAAKELVKSDVTAFFISNDMMALGVLKYLSEHQLEVPDDYSIISYDNILNQYIFQYQIDSIEQDITMLAKKATEILFKMLEDNTYSKSICLKPQLILNHSTRNIK